MDIESGPKSSGKPSKIVTRYRISRFLRILGPGVVTGAADDDPSGIATYSQTGALFGLGMAWLMLFTFPLMTAVQEACARIGAVKGKGLASVIKDHFPRSILFGVVFLVVIANCINLGADIGAMAAAVRLLIPVPFFVLIFGFTLLVITLEVAVSYKTLAKVLKWLALTLLAYPLTAVIVGLPWREVARATVTPHIEWNLNFFYIMVGVLGTTISPYLFFWQPSEVVEDEIAEHRLAQKGGTPRLSKRFLKNLRIDNGVGMLISNFAAWFIIITGAVVLNRHGITNVATAADAAKALEPLVKGFPHAGVIAKLIFATGIVGLGLLAVPVLAGSAAYAVSEAVGWQEGLYRKFKQAHGFYVVMALATVSGLLINVIGIDPIKALVFTAVFNGVAAIPLIGLIALIGRRRDIMGGHASGRLSSVLVWLTFAVMLAAGGVLAVGLISGS